MLWLSVEQDYFEMNYIEDRDPDKIHRKKSRFFKVFKVTGNKCITTVSQNSKKRVNKEVKMTMVDFQQQSPQ